MGLLVAAVLLMTGSSVQAQQANSPLKVSFTNITLQHDSARAKGGSTTALPDDTLRYVLAFTNTQERALRDVVFTNPIPAGLVLVSGSVKSTASTKVEYSIDGGHGYSEQPMVLVEENGRKIRRPATPDSYTHIRWTITGSIAPGATVTAQYDTRVSR
jgi:uncharacterized repeat protein (TIGR01451 family)